MEIEVAVGLIRSGVIDQGPPQTWSELGAGTGLFTKALGLLLPQRSTIIAIDNNAAALKSIEKPTRDIKLVKTVADFVHDSFDLPPLNGILMANALHFSPNKTGLLKTLKDSLVPAGKVILVEYDTDSANQWVPYPVSLKTLFIVANAAGFKDVKKIGETSSVYNRAMIYSAVLS